MKNVWQSMNSHPLFLRVGSKIHSLLTALLPLKRVSERSSASIIGLALV